MLMEQDISIITSIVFGLNPCSNGMLMEPFGYTLDLLGTYSS